MDAMCLRTEGAGLARSWGVFDFLMVTVGSRVVGLHLLNGLWVGAGHAGMVFMCVSWLFPLA